jgi:hypothetical protein
MPLAAALCHVLVAAVCVRQSSPPLRPAISAAPVLTRILLIHKFHQISLNLYIFRDRIFLNGTMCSRYILQQLCIFFTMA